VCCDFLNNLWRKHFFILRRIPCDITSVHLLVEYPLFLSDFNENLDFLDKLSKYDQIPNFREIRPVEAESLHAGVRTDKHEEANSRFSKFCERA
jgi:hypothetical protein